MADSTTAYFATMLALIRLKSAGFIKNNIFTQFIKVISDFFASNGLILTHPYDTVALV